MNATFHDPATGAPWLEGQLYTRHSYAATLEKLAEAGDQGKHYLGFYTGRVAMDLVADLKEMGGIITRKDMAGYKARWVEPVKVSKSSFIYCHSAHR
jgi:gamma-glutamyltranspeptidase/glutathione hydrolase